MHIYLKNILFKNNIKPTQPKKNVVFLYIQFIFIVFKTMI